MLLPATDPAVASTRDIRDMASQVLSPTRRASTNPHPRPAFARRRRTPRRPTNPRSPPAGPRAGMTTTSAGTVRLLESTFLILSGRIGQANPDGRRRGGHGPLAVGSSRLRSLRRRWRERQSRAWLRPKRISPVWLWQPAIRRLRRISRRPQGEGQGEEEQERQGRPAPWCGRRSGCGCRCGRRDCSQTR